MESVLERHINDKDSDDMDQDTVICARKKQCFSVYLLCKCNSIVRITLYIYADADMYKLKHSYIGSITVLLGFSAFMAINIQFKLKRSIFLAYHNHFNTFTFQRFLHLKIPNRQQTYS